MNDKLYILLKGPGLRIVKKRLLFNFRLTLLLYLFDGHPGRTVQDHPGIRQVILHGGRIQVPAVLYLSMENERIPGGIFPGREFPLNNSAAVLGPGCMQQKDTEKSKE